MIERVVTGATRNTADATGDLRRQDEDELLAEAHRLYDTYVKPLEPEHRGEDVAVSAEGRFVIAPTEIDALRDGVAALGPDPFLFEVGRFAAAWRQ